jgi:hypothetical protein
VEQQEEQEADYLEQQEEQEAALRLEVSELELFGECYQMVVVPSL